MTRTLLSALWAADIGECGEEGSDATVKEKEAMTSKALASPTSAKGNTINQYSVIYVWLSIFPVAYSEKVKPRQRQRGILRRNSQAVGDGVTPLGVRTRIMLKTRYLRLYKSDSYV